MFMVKCQPPDRYLVSLIFNLGCPGGSKLVAERGFTQALPFGDTGSRLSGCGSVLWILWEVFVFHGFGFVGDLIACCGDWDLWSTKEGSSCGSAGSGEGTFGGFPFTFWSVAHWTTEVGAVCCAAWP